MHLLCTPNSSYMGILCFFSLPPLFFLPLFLVLPFLSYSLPPSLLFSPSRSLSLFLSPLLPLPYTSSNVAEMVIFLFLGYSLYDVTVHNWDTGLVLWTLVLVLLFRPIGRTVGCTLYSRPIWWSCDSFPTLQPCA